MKFKEGFVLREIAGEKIVTAEGLENINFNKLLSLNSTAAFLWEKLYGTEFETDTVADLLVENYGIDRELAEHDAKSICDSWRSAGVLI